MGFKEKAKIFWINHGYQVLGSIAFVATAGLAGYGAYKLFHPDDDEPKANASESEYIETTFEDEDLKWKKEYDDDMYGLELTTRQMQHIDGYSWIIAGPNSYYNDNDDTIDIYLVDNYGNYFKKPDDEDYYFFENLNKDKNK